MPLKRIKLTCPVCKKKVAIKLMGFSDFNVHLFLTCGHELKLYIKSTAKVFDKKVLLEMLK